MPCDLEKLPQGSDWTPSKGSKTQAEQEYREVEHKNAEAEHEFDAQGVQSMPRMSKGIAEK